MARFKDGRFTPFTTREGLYDNTAYGILEDASGHLWVSGNRGVFRVAKADLDDVAEGRARHVRSVAYGESDGMASAECNGGTPSGWRTDDGRLWFPTVKGVVVVDPSRLRTNLQPPPVVVEEMLADGASVDALPEGELPPGRQKFEFRYTGLSLLTPAKVRFRYRLEGLDRDWVEAGTRRAAYYTNLAPGPYRFQVLACNNDGVWSDTGASLSFRLRPQVYETAWFRTLSGAAALLAAAGLYRLRTRQLRARAAELARLVEEGTRDLREAIRQKDEVVSMVAHDIRSPLTAIQGYAELIELRVPNEETRRFAADIRRQVAHLTSLASDMLTMSRIETGPLPLNLEGFSLPEIVRSVVDDRVSDSGADVALDAPDDRSAMVRADPRWIRQVVENLVNNAVKYSPDGAQVRVRVAATAEALQVSVADRGIGIAPGDMDRLFRKFSRLDAARTRGIEGTGLGLFICRSIVEAHGGRIWAESEAGGGSTFHFVLPRTPAV